MSNGLTSTPGSRRSSCRRWRGCFWLALAHPGAARWRWQNFAPPRPRARRLRAALAQHKLDVATGYASLAALESVEERLTAHLLRIEAKLDGGARHECAGTCPRPRKGGAQAGQRTYPPFAARRACVPRKRSPPPPSTAAAARRHLERRLRRGGAGFRRDLRRPAPATRPPSGRADAVWRAVCRRIAARAVAGAGPDPAGGAHHAVPRAAHRLRECEHRH